MRSAISFVASWLAAWCQVVVVAAMPLASVAVAAADPLGDVPICHAGLEGGGGQQSPTQPGHSDHECVLCCALCMVHGWSAAILSPAPLLPARASVVVARVAAAQPRAPPVRVAFAAQPRGPPSLI
jgi:hypothetical protein